jgi:hypothetical protein
MTSIRPTALFAALLGAVVVVTVPSAATAVQSAQDSVVSAVPAGYTPEVDNGIVYAIGQSGSTVVLGGTFTSVSPVGSSATTAVSDLAAFTAGSGSLVSSFTPTVNGTVDTIIPGPTSGTVYVGGGFSTIDGVTSRLALISTTTGAIVPGWTSPSVNGAVNTLVLAGGRLLVGGYFTTVASTPEIGLAALNPTTGALDGGYAVPNFSGHHNYDTKCIPSGTATCAEAATGIKSMDINPAGTRLVTIGNFTSVDGYPRDQIAVIDLGASAAAVDAGWATDAYTDECNGASFDTYMRDVQFSPDGSYFVVAVTGGGTGTKNSDNTQTSCDAAARFDPSASGGDVRPAWIDYTGNDSFLSVAITGTAVYVGGHQRWVNNSTGSDTPKEGAVPRPGIVAFDPVNGLPLAWNPGRNPRGAGAYALLATSEGLYVGSDTDFIGNGKYLRKKIAFFPLAGGGTLTTNQRGALPGTVFLLGTGAESKSARAVPWNGSSDPGPPMSLAPTNWSTARGAFEINNEVYYGDSNGDFYERSFNGTSFGPAVTIDPYDDPTWDGVDTGSGQTYRGLKSSFYGEVASLTSLFYDDGRIYYTRTGKSQMFWRWFEPDSGVVGADEFTTADGLDWSQVSGAFLSGSTLYFADSTTTALRKVRFVGGQASGTPHTANASINWTSHGAFVSSSETATSLSVSPTGTIKQHQHIRLIATVSVVSDPAVHPPGSVTFKDGARTLGTAAVDTHTGQAALSTSAAPPSAPKHAVLTAFFRPADGSSETSASPPVTTTIDPVATAPSLSGKVRVGSTVTCTEPKSAGETIHHVWLVAGKSVAAGPTYRIPTSAFDKPVGCRVTVSVGTGPTSKASSRLTRAGVGAALKERGRPTLSGRHAVGTVETVSHGRWAPAAASYSYQWYAGSRKIRHATKRTLRLSGSVRGRLIHCRVRAHRARYAAGTAISKSVQVRR